MKSLIATLAGFSLFFCQSKNSESIKYKIPKYLEEAFTKNFSVKEKNETVSFYTLKIGELDAPTGKIIASDGLIPIENLPFSEIFPVGNFAVELAIAKFKNNDERVGFARIKFSNNLPVKWKMAICDGDDIQNLKDNEFFGFDVDTGTGLFIDEASKKDFNDFIYIEKNGDMLIDKMENKDWFFWEKNNKNAAIFSSGFGDSTYASYIGYDKENNICRLVINFQVIGN